LPRLIESAIATAHSTKEDKKAPLEMKEVMKTCQKTLDYIYTTDYLNLSAVSPNKKQLK
jgi:hypothetical protein